MKKIISTIIASILFASCAAITLPYNVYAESYNVTDKEGNIILKFEYELVDGFAEIDAVTIRGSYAHSDELVFPAKIDGYTVKKVKDVTFYNDNGTEELKSIIFEDGIEVIENVYLPLKNVTSVQFPNTLKELSGSFEMAALKEVNLPKSLEKLDCDFSRCSSLKSVVIPGSLEHLNNSFSNCENLTDVTIEEGVKFIGKEAFLNDGITNITIPDSVTSIGAQAFENCFNLKDIKLSQNLEHIGDKAFYKSGIEKIKLPSSLKEIGEWAFAHTKLKEVKLPDSLEKVGKHAFQSCEELTKTNIPNGIKHSPLYLWLGCNKLSEITFEGEITKEIYDDVVLGVSIPWGETYNKNFADDFVIFDGHLSKYSGKDKNPVIPDNVTSLGEHAFRNTDIDTVTFSSNIKEIPEMCFRYSKIKEVVIPSTIKKVGSYAFSQCDELSKLVIEDGVETIGAYAFQNCRKLFDVTKGKNVKQSATAFDKTPLDAEFVANGNISTPKPTETAKPTATVKPTETAEPTTTPAPEVLTVESGDEITVKVNDKAVTFPDAKPFVDDNGRTQVPVRAVSEMLNAKVDWQQDSATAVITKDNGDTVKITLNSDVMTVNERNVQMDTAAMLKDDRTFIPVRFVAEALGLTVNWVE